MCGFYSFLYVRSCFPQIKLNIFLLNINGLFPFSFGLITLDGTSSAMMNRSVESGGLGFRGKPLVLWSLSIMLAMGLSSIPSIRLSKIGSVPVFFFFYHEWMLDQVPFSTSANMTVHLFPWYVLSCVRLFETPWTVACQAPLSMEFPNNNTVVGCHFLLQSIFLTQGSNLHLLNCRQILYLWATGGSLKQDTGPR